MKNIAIKPLFLINYLLLIFYVSWNIKGEQPAIISGIPLLIPNYSRQYKLT